MKKDAIPEIETLEGATSSRFREEVDSIILPRRDYRDSGPWRLILWSRPGTCHYVKLIGIKAVVIIIVPHLFQEQNRRKAVTQSYGSKT